MQPCPDELLKNQRFAFIKGHPEAARHAVQVRAARPERRVGQRAAAALRHGRRRHRLRPVDVRPTSSTTPRPSCSCYTGSPRIGGAAMGSWITYGLGSENQDLPGFVVLISGGTDPTGGKSALEHRLPASVYQGVQCRTVGRPDPVRQRPQGHGPRRPPPQPRRPRTAQRVSSWSEFGDPETLTRISQYELAFRMQMAVPEVMDIAQEPSTRPRAVRRRAGRGVVRQQLPAGPPAGRARRALRPALRLGLGHATAPAPATTSSTGLPKKCREIDRPIAALLKRPEAARAARRDAGRSGAASSAARR